MSHTEKIPPPDQEHVRPKQPSGSIEDFTKKCKSLRNEASGASGLCETANDERKHGVAFEVQFEPSQTMDEKAGLAV